MFFSKYYQGLRTKLNEIGGDKWHVWTKGKGEQKTLVWGETNGNRQLGRTTLNDKYIYIYIKEIGWTSVEWIDLDQDREKRYAVVNTVMNLLF